ncbi:MAG: hypothetical protein ACXWBM_04250, partial [Chthoniobacterales bacterium]
RALMAISRSGRTSEHPIFVTENFAPRSGRLQLIGQAMVELAELVPKGKSCRRHSFFTIQEERHTDVPLAFCKLIMVKAQAASLLLMAARRRQDISRPA